MSANILNAIIYGMDYAAEEGIYTRIYENEPMEYDHQAFLKLAEEFDVQVSDVECTAGVQHCTTNEQHRTAENEQQIRDDSSKDKLIKVLEEQLEEANKSRANLEKLLDQQQLTLISNKKLELLKLEIEASKLEKKSEKLQVFGKEYLKEGIKK